MNFTPTPGLIGKVIEHRLYVRQRYSQLECSKATELCGCLQHKCASDMETPTSYKKGNIIGNNIEQL